MPKQIFVQTIFIDLSEDKVISEFLNFQKKGTRNTYTVYFRKLKMFTTETGKEMLTNHTQWERKIFAFKRWLLSLIHI